MPVRERERDRQTETETETETERDREREREREKVETSSVSSRTYQCCIPFVDSLIKYGHLREWWRSVKKKYINMIRLELS